MKIIALQDARERNLSRYFTGNPCSQGHIAERRTGNSHCIECDKLVAQAQRLERQARIAKERKLSRGMKRCYDCHELFALDTPNLRVYLARHHCDACRQNRKTEKAKRAQRVYDHKLKLQRIANADAVAKKPKCAKFYGSLSYDDVSPQTLDRELSIIGAYRMPAPPTTHIPREAAA